MTVRAAPGGGMHLPPGEGSTPSASVRHARSSGGALPIGAVRSATRVLPVGVMCCGSSIGRAVSHELTCCRFESGTQMARAQQPRGSTPHQAIHLEHAWIEGPPTDRPRLTRTRDRRSSSAHADQHRGPGSRLGGYRRPRRGEHHSLQPTPCIVQDQGGTGEMALPLTSRLNLSPAEEPGGRARGDARSALNINVPNPQSTLAAAPCRCTVPCDSCTRPTQGAEP